MEYHDTSSTDLYRGGTLRPIPSALGLVAVLAAAAPGAALAQHEVAAGLVISDPQGRLDENTDTGFGFSVSYLYALHPSRAVAIGAVGSFLNYGRVERRVPLSTTIPDIRADVETSNNMGFLQGLLQLKAPTRSVQPYVQGTGGLGWFATTTTLEDVRSERAILSDTNQSDATWVLGAGGGLQVHVHTGQRAEDDEREPVRAYVDLGARWLTGGDVEYLKEGSLVTPEGRFDISSRLARSEIEIVEYRIGVTVEF